MNKRKNPARTKLCVLAQLCKRIPSHATAKIARELEQENFGRRSLPGPLGNRSLLQAKQADPQAGGIYRIQQKRNRVAGVGRIARLAARSFPGVPFEVASQLHQTDGSTALPCLGAYPHRGCG